jgi:hypothetical protein
MDVHRRAWASASSFWSRASSWVSGRGNLRRRGRRDLLDGGVLLAEKIKETFSQRLAELEHAL